MEAWGLKTREEGVQHREYWGSLSCAEKPGSTKCCLSLTAKQWAGLAKSLVEIGPGIGVGPSWINQLLAYSPADAGPEAQPHQSYEINKMVILSQ